MAGKQLDAGPVKAIEVPETSLRNPSVLQSCAITVSGIHSGRRKQYLVIEGQKSWALEIREESATVKGWVVKAFPIPDALGACSCQ